MDIRELAEKIQYLIDLEDVKKLQRKYQYWLFKQDYEKIATSFACQTPGVRMEASDSGIFKGRKGVERFFIGW